MEITVSRKAHFNAAHRLDNKKWSVEKNKQVFGKCNYPNYHGHNYELIVSVSGKINPNTGYVIDMGELKGIIKNEIDNTGFFFEIPDKSEIFSLYSPFDFNKYKQEKAPMFIIT